MDVNDLRIGVTVLSFAAFAGIVWWVWARRNSAGFVEAAQLPFVVEAAQLPSVVGAAQLPLVAEAAQSPLLGEKIHGDKGGMP